jgi:hypothetical protein
MAILGRVTVDELLIITVDTDPTVANVSAPVGSIALIDNGTSARIWVKTGSADSAWTQQLAPVPGTAMQANTLLYTDTTGQVKTDTTRFTYDPTNARLGIGLGAPATPVSTIHIDRGTGVGGHIRFTAGTTTGQTSGDGLEVGIDNAGNAELIQYENSNMNFYTNNTLVGAFSNTGKFIVGATSTPIDITGLSVFPQFQIIGIAAVQMAGIQYSADTIGPVFNLLKSRGTTIGTQGIVSQDDEFGRIQFRASDGVNFQAGASIRGLVDGTAAAGSMPGRLIFMTTPSGSTTPVEQMRIDNTGLVRVVGTLRSRSGITDTTVQATANTTTTLTSSSNGVQVFTGSTAGQILKMPDATTLVVGQQFIIYNQSTASVAVQDNTGGAIKTAPTLSITVVNLQANGTAAGTWSATVSFDTAAQEVNSTSGMSINSTTDVLITSMTITPTAGTYRVVFDATVTVGNAGSTLGFAIYAGGTINSNSNKTFTVLGGVAPGGGQNWYGTTGTVTVDGTQAIEIRGRRSAGTTTVGTRTLHIMRVG